MEKESSVLIIILNYKTYQLTLNLIEQLKKLNYPSFDILVIDNNSSNESGKILKEKADILNYTFIQNSKNTGYAAGNNIGLKYAIANKYDYSLIANNDLKILDNNFLEVLVNVAENNSHIACVGPKVIDINNNIVPPYINKPTKRSMTIGLRHEKKIRANYEETSGIVYRIFGCCMLLNNKYMKLVNYMDERTFLYCEEEILAERLLKYNLYSYYCADTSIKHMESMSVGKNKGLKNLNKIKIQWNSMDIYLREYLKLNKCTAFMCKLIRAIVSFIRG